MKPSRVAGMVIWADVERLSCPKNPGFGREAEIEHLDPAVGVGLDIGWLQVAVHDPAFVRRFDGMRDLSGDRQGVRDRQGPIGETVGQRRPFDELEHECPEWAGLLEPIDRGNVRVIQRGE